MARPKVVSAADAARLIPDGAILSALPPEGAPAHPEDRMIEKMGDRVIETLGVPARLQAT